MDVESVEPEIVLEDGEIFSDDEVETQPIKIPKSLLEEREIDYDVEYVPLERPIDIESTYKKSEYKLSDYSDLSIVSESDSDDSIKKQKVNKKLRKKIKPPIKRKKYNIWCSHIQEDVLTETLVSCDVSRIDRSRNVESYQPLHLRQKLNGIRRNKNRTMQRDDSIDNTDKEVANHKHINKNFNLRDKLNAKKQGHKRKIDQKIKQLSMQRQDDSDDDDDDDIKGSKRILLDLVTNVENTNEEVAKDIANKLCEEKDDLIMRIVQIAGKRKSIEIFNDTKRIELDGGMLIMNQTRRRTPGGVFIFLLKRDNDVTEEQLKEIFVEERREQTRIKKVNQKQKLKAMKAEIAAKRAINQNLPVLLSRSELEIQKNKIVAERVESESDEFVINPPPSPVIDGKENSNDGMDIPSYFLDSGNLGEMDEF